MLRSSTALDIQSTYSRDDPRCLAMIYQEVLSIDRLQTYQRGDRSWGQRIDPSNIRTFIRSIES